MSFFTRAPVGALVVVVAACADLAAPVAPLADGIPASSDIKAQLAQESRARPISEHFRRLADEAPGFAGVFLDERGDLTVSVATPDFSAESLERIVGWAHAFSPSTSMRTSVRVRLVAYDYRTLSARMSDVLGAIRETDNLVTSAIDETQGRIVLGFTSLPAAESVRARLLTAGVPEDMVAFEQHPAPTAQTTLNQLVRPVVGGVQVKAHNASGPCTLGFNVMKWDTGTDPYSSPMYFLTAGHCGEVWGTLGSAWYQPLSDKIGDEFQVVPIRTSPSCAATKSPCVDADVLVVRYDSGMAVPDSIAYGNVAKVDASKTIIGYYNVQGTSGGLTGQTVTFVGQVSGQKTGVISRSCEDVKVGDPINYVWVLCQQRANYVAQNGDSGAPVFIPYTPGNPFTPAMVGIHSNTASDGYRWFSPINQIDYALFNAYYHQ